MVESWNLVRLGDVADVLVGYPFKSQYFNENNKGIRLLRGKNVTHRGLRWGSDTRWWESITPDVERYLLSENDIVIGMDGSLVGKNYALISNSDLPLLLVQRVACIRAKTGVDQKYLWFVIASEKFERYIDSIRTGTSIPHVSSKQILDYTISLPPLPVQKKIAAILSSLDDKIAINTRMNKVLEETARALFHRWFVEFEFPNDEGKPYKSSGGLMIASEMGEIPEGWRVGTVGDIAVLNPESWSSKNKPKNINYLDLSNVRNGTIQNIISYSFDIAPSRARRVLRIGDTIIGTVRPGNRSFALISENGLTGSTGFAVLRSHNMLTRYYLYLHLTQDSMIQTFTRLATGGAYPAITPQLIVEQTILLPSQKILNLFHESVVAIFHRINLNAREIRFLNEIRETLLPELLSVQE